jgi:hypothetical protein
MPAWAKTEWEAVGGIENVFGDVVPLLAIHQYLEGGLSLKVELSGYHVDWAVAPVYIEFYCYRFRHGSLVALSVLPGA